MFLLAVDFDGTIVDHQFPGIGLPVPGAFIWLKALKGAGATLILWTMRSDGQAYGPTLTQAVDFCKRHGVEFDFVNSRKLDWTDSPKVFANAYVDDSAIGCPLRENPRMGGRPFVDWDVVGPMVLKLMDG